MIYSTPITILQPSQRSSKLERAAISPALQAINTCAEAITTPRGICDHVVRVKKSKSFDEFLENGGHFKLAAIVFAVVVSAFFSPVIAIVIGFIAFLLGEVLFLAAKSQASIDVENSLPNQLSVKNQERSQASIDVENPLPNQLSVKNQERIEFKNLGMPTSMRDFARVRGGQRYHFLRPNAFLSLPASSNTMDNSVRAELSIIPYDQSKDLIAKLNNNEHQSLLALRTKYNGLCEFVCNLVLMDDLLGSCDVNYLKEHIRVKIIDTDEVKRSHLLSIASSEELKQALLQGIYPDNIFSIDDQKKLVSRYLDTSTFSVNQEILRKGLENCNPGEVLKLGIFKKREESFKGHSFLIKKVDDSKYIFFDPNFGEMRNLSFIQICENIDTQLKALCGEDIYLTKGSVYLQKCKKK